jgi:primosomal protein N' (replication factor Y)
LDGERMIAQVIVDVASQQTDRIFEYQIPAELSNLQVGARVIVPFGRRKVQGFVVGISQQASFAGRLKPLLVDVDELPPLTPELLQLSTYLAQTVFAYRISILQAMLPQVMRADYRKELRPLSPEAEKLPLFTHGNFEMPTEIAPDLAAKIRQLLQTNQAEIEYVVGNRAKKKQTWLYALTKSQSEYQALLGKTRSNAKKQRAFLRLALKQASSFPLPQAKLEAMLAADSAFLKQLVEKNWLSRKQVEVLRQATQAVAPSRPLKLNAQQDAALAQITPVIQEKQAKTFLLEGVTGSGKTEIYLQAISQTLKQKRTALMLVPEISLTPQMVRQVKSRFGNLVAVLHSGLSSGEKYDEWRRIRRGQAKVVVGARSAVFAPLENIGLLVIDEEHESSYKQDIIPRYHARDVARWRSKYNHCPLILGSATPSLDSRARAQKGVYQLIRITERANQQPLPTVKLLDLKQTIFAGKQVDLTTNLVEKLKQTIASGHQAILLLNRRGFSRFMLCRNCGFVLKCPHCDLSLTYHKDINRMQCHYCGYEGPVPQRCPQCQSQQIRFLGTGTQKVQEELADLLPQASVLRMDVDTTRRKGSYRRILTAFGQGRADILLGTQMIAKGLDFPNVTLVGVINADTSLWMPDYKSSEHTFELLTQVAGRAGRAENQGEVLIQTYNPNHYAIKLAQTQDYEAFYRQEMAVRHAGNYPPYYFTVLISVAATKEQAAAKQAFVIKRKLLAALHLPTIVLGPTPSAISKLKNEYYYQILVKYKREPALNELLHQVQADAQVLDKQGIHVYIDPSPERLL